MSKRYIYVRTHCNVCWKPNLNMLCEECGKGLLEYAHWLSERGEL